MGAWKLLPRFDDYFGHEYVIIDVSRKQEALLLRMKYFDGWLYFAFILMTFRLSIFEKRVLIE